MSGNPDDMKRLLDTYNRNLMKRFAELWSSPQKPTYRKIAEELNIPFNKAISLGAYLRKDHKDQPKLIAPRMQTRYTIQGKITTPMTDTDFVAGMKHMDNNDEPLRYKSYTATLYYSAIRKSEALRMTPEQITQNKNNIVMSIGTRLKHGIETPSLPIPLNLPYVNTILETAQTTKHGRRMYPYCKKTGYNIVHRYFHYPHFFRLSRITNLFAMGWTIDQVHSWTGLSIRALEYYIGLVDVQKMGESLK